MPLRPPAGYIRPGYNPLQVANAPTVGTASAGDTTASVAFTAPSNVGGGAISLYYAVSSPGQFTGTSVTSPVTVTGLTNGTSYTFTVWAANPFGPSPYSASSNSVTPSFTYIEDVFSTWLYTGNGANRSINNGIDLSTKGGLVWIKDRTAVASNALYDTARGANNLLISNNTNAQNAQTDALTAFNTNGFSLGVDSSTLVNASGDNFVSWTFREQAKFFDVVTWTGDDVDGRQIPHSLGSTPGCIIIKRTSQVGAWTFWHRSLGSTGGFPNYLLLNTTDASFAGNSSFVRSWDSTTFTVGAGGNFNRAGDTYVAYLFAHNAGGFGLTGTDNVISCGSYTGNGSTDGPTVTLGYEPQWVLIKEASAAGNQWVLFDNMRGMPVGSNDNYLFPNLSNAESSAYDLITPTATGFSLAQSLGIVNASGSTYIYIAIRRGPMKTPTTGTSVFNPVANSNNINASTPVALNPSASDLWLNSSLSSAAPYWLPRLAGWGYTRSSNTSAENTSYTWTQTTQSNLLPNLTWWGTNPSQINYFFKRAPGFFDVVCWTGTNPTAQNINHNLGVAPELIIVKRRSGANDWLVYAASLGKDKGVPLNLTDAPYSSTNFWNDTTPTSSVFSVGNSGFTNLSGATYVGYLFASCPGVSKVGSYTGTGNTLQIDCGFTGGARFVLIRRTDSAGDWHVWDSARGIVSGNDPYLLLNTAAAEVTNTDWVDTHSPGFELSNSGGNSVNISTATYIFLAIA